MLNALTIRRRAELRRARAGALTLSLAALSFASAAVIGGLWCHCLPVVLCATIAFPLVQHARRRTRALSKVLRQLGA